MAWVKLLLCMLLEPCIRGGLGMAEWVEGWRPVALLEGVVVGVRMKRGFPSLCE